MESMHSPEHKPDSPLAELRENIASATSDVLRQLALSMRLHVPENPLLCKKVLMTAPFPYTAGGREGTYIRVPAVFHVIHEDHFRYHLSDEEGRLVGVVQKSSAPGNYRWDQPVVWKPAYDKIQRTITLEQDGEQWVGRGKGTVPKKEGAVHPILNRITDKNGHTYVEIGPPLEARLTEDERKNYPMWVDQSTDMDGDRTAECGPLISAHQLDLLRAATDLFITQMKTKTAPNRRQDTRPMLGKWKRAIVGAVSGQEIETDPPNDQLQAFAASFRKLVDLSSGDGGIVNCINMTANDIANMTETEFARFMGNLQNDLARLNDVINAKGSYTLYEPGKPAQTWKYFR